MAKGIADQYLVLNIRQQSRMVNIKNAAAKAPARGIDGRYFHK
jgi:hypothetical protein